MSKLVRTSSFPTWLIDPVRPTAQVAREAYRPTTSKMWTVIPLGVGIAALAASLVGVAVDTPRFYFSYLIGWTFCLSISIGSLFFVLIQHLTRAKWSVVVRRIAETLLWSFPLLAILFIPILFGMHDLYHWTHHDLVDEGSPAFDPIIAGKAGYLNVPFFLIRIVIYFVIWCALAYRLYVLSVRQDLDNDPETPAMERKVSAVGLALTALTTAFASYDLLMSLDPHWFSTIFGVYFFAASFWTAHAFIALVVIFLQRSGDLRGVVTQEHFHDLGKMMFGFTVFWAYIAFSQYMLIWYGNLPEETVWYRHRLEHGWEVQSAILLIAHFIIPFWVLLPKGAKRSTTVLTIMGIWFMVMNWFDLRWIAMPVLSPENAAINWIDVACWIGLFGIYVGVFTHRLSRHSLVPQNDPYVTRSLAFVNH